jgi:uroporphyrinogen III methyltransferase / synthase
VKPITTDGDETQVLNFYRKSVSREKPLLLPGAAEFPSPFGALLNDAGYTVANLAVYHLEPLKNLLVHNLPDFHGVVFTSPEAVSRFSEVYNGFPHYLEYAFRGAFARKQFIGLGGVIKPSIKSSPSEKESAALSEIESAFYRMVL